MMNTHDDLGDSLKITKTNGRDFGDSLKITKTEGRQLNAPGTWVSGTIAGHTFQVLVFEDHAETEEYELETSRISKLWLQRQADRQVVANFDRGWDLQPTTDEARDCRLLGRRDRRTHLWPLTPKRQMASLGGGSPGLMMAANHCTRIWRRRDEGERREDRWRVRSQNCR